MSAAEDRQRAQRQREVDDMRQRPTIAHGRALEGGAKPAAEQTPPPAARPVPPPSPEFLRRYGD